MAPLPPSLPPPDPPIGFPVFGLLFTVDGFSSSSEREAEEVTLPAGDADAAASADDVSADATAGVEETLPAGAPPRCTGSDEARPAFD